MPKVFFCTYSHTPWGGIESWLSGVTGFGQRDFITVAVLNAALAHAKLPARCLPLGVGSAKLLALASLIGVPIGFIGGVYLAEFGGSTWTFVVRYTTDLLNGVPSIVIGIFEATSIDRRVKKMLSPRPLTHDLIASVVDSLGAELQDIYINELRDHTYFAKLRIRQNGELVEIDSRPSDAIALAVTASVPIYVAEDVLTEASGDE